MHIAGGGAYVCTSGDLQETGSQGHIIIGAGGAAVDQTRAQNMPELGPPCAQVRPFLLCLGGWSAWWLFVGWIIWRKRQKSRNSLQLMDVQ